MKNILLLFAAALGLAANLSAQETETEDGFINAFTAEKTEWIIDYTNLDGDYPKEIAKVILEGDTVVDKKNWKIVRENDKQGESYGWGFIRVDGPKVIFKSLDTYEFKEEVVIYDFSLEAGDSILADNVGATWYKKIAKVDSVILNDEKKHKRLIFESNGNEAGSYIEGLGSAYIHPLFMLMPEVVGNNHRALVCCHVNGQLFYKNPYYANCEGSWVANETIETPDNFKISMSDNVLHVTFEEEKSFDIAVYSLNGVLLKQRKGNSKEAIIPVYSGKGILVVRVTCGNDTYSRKVYNL